MTIPFMPCPSPTPTVQDVDFKDYTQNYFDTCFEGAVMLAMFLFFVSKHFYVKLKKKRKHVSKVFKSTT